MELPLVKWAVENPSDVSRETWRGLATNLAAIANDAEDDEELFEACLAKFHEISEKDDQRYSQGAATRCFHDAMNSAKKYGPMTYSHMCENGAPDAACPSEFKTPIAAARVALRQAERAAPRQEPPPKADAPAAAPAPAGAQSTAGNAPAAEKPCAPAEPQATKEKVGAAAEEDEGDDVGDIFDHKPEEFLFDTASGYLLRDKNGAWDTVAPIKVQAFDQMLKSLGLANAKQVDAFKAQIRYFNERKPFYAKPTEYYVVVDGIPYFNTYQPSKIVPAQGSWDDVRALLLNLVGMDPEALDYILDWLAAPLQSLRYKGKPMKMGTGPVFHGEQGSGKGTLHSIINLLYGPKNVALLSQDSLDSRFNGELIDKLFVTANEVVSSTNRSMEVANKLKMWVTDPEIPIEEKFKGVVLKPNNFNITFTSNDDRPVIIEKGDRRYPVFKSKKFDKTIVRRIYDDLFNGKQQVAALFDHLLARQVKIGFGDMFETEARRQLMLAGMSPEARFAAEFATDGWYAVAEPWRAAGNPDNPRDVNPVWHEGREKEGIPSHMLRDVCNEYCCPPRALRARRRA